MAGLLLNVLEHRPGEVRNDPRDFFLRLPRVLFPLVEDREGVEEVGAGGLFEAAGDEENRIGVARESNSLLGHFEEGGHGLGGFDDQDVVRAEGEFLDGLAENIFLLLTRHHLTSAISAPSNRFWSRISGGSIFSRLRSRTQSGPQNR